MLNKAIDYTTNRLIFENLQKNGSVTIEEATFLNKLASDIITEAVNEMGIEIPEENDMLLPSEETPETPETEEMEEVPESDKVLTDEQGNEFIYDPVTGGLNPVDTPATEVPENMEDGLGQEPETENDIDQVLPTEGMVPELGEGLMESDYFARKLLKL
jgi:hypothetical protein